MRFAGAARNRHTLLSFHVQSSFTIDGIRYSARRCSRSAGTEGRAVREAWFVCCRINTWALVPEWMTSREACARCQLTESPEVSLSALFELAATLDAKTPLAVFSP